MSDHSSVSSFATRPTLSDFMARYFTHKVQKIPVNAGFTCPNRDGSKGWGGCTFCNNRSFNPDLRTDDPRIRAQLETGIARYWQTRLHRAERRKRPLGSRELSTKFLAYFQAYTGTYDRFDRLVTVYEEALQVPDVVGVVIGTRPDCMSEPLLQYLADLHRRAFVMIEYGVESLCDDTLRRINRGHTADESVAAINRTAAAGIPVGAHFIVGLPGEERKDVLRQASRINALPLDTVKFHQLQIVRGTTMAHEWEQYRPTEGMTFVSPHFTLYTLDDYVQLMVDVIERLRTDIIVERVASSSPSSMLIAPKWGVPTREVGRRVAAAWHERHGIALTGTRPRLPELFRTIE